MVPRTEWYGDKLFEITFNGRNIFDEYLTFLWRTYCFTSLLIYFSEIFNRIRFFVGGLSKELPSWLVKTGQQCMQYYILLALYTKYIRHTQIWQTYNVHIIYNIYIYRIVSTINLFGVRNPNFVLQHTWIFCLPPHTPSA